MSGRGFSGVCRWTDGPCGVELNCELLSVPNRCKREEDERGRGPAGCNETKKPFRGGWMDGDGGGGARVGSSAAGTCPFSDPHSLATSVQLVGPSLLLGIWNL